MRRLILFTLLLSIVLFLTTSVFARSGCCSHHGGVCGCGSNGRQLCCDGTYSPSCTCNFNQPVNDLPLLPTPTPITLPSSIKGTSKYHYNNLTNSYDVTFNWSDWNLASGWSIGLSQFAGSDPGSVVDTTSTTWTFKNIYPGSYYVNLKALVNNHWSEIYYWHITVPALPTKTPFPTITPTPSLTLTPKTKKLIKQKKLDKDQKKQKKTFWQYLFNK